MIGQQERAAEEMAHRLEIETAVAQTSKLLVAVDDIDTGLNAALGILAEAVGADDAFVFMLRDGNTKMDNTHEWCAPGIRSQMHKFQDMDCASYPWFMKKLAQNEAIIVPDVSAMPDEAAAEREVFQRQRVLAFVEVPLGKNTNQIGFVGFYDIRSTRDWRDEDVKLLRIASESISSVIERKRAEQALRESDERYGPCLTGLWMPSTSTISRGDSSTSTMQRCRILATRGKTSRISASLICWTEVNCGRHLPSPPS